MLNPSVEPAAGYIKIPHSIKDKKLFSSWLFFMALYNETHNHALQYILYYQLFTFFHHWHIYYKRVIHKRFVCQMKYVFGWIFSAAHRLFQFVILHTYTWYFECVHTEKYSNVQCTKNPRMAYSELPICWVCNTAHFSPTVVTILAT